jgi:hypothetical protein
VQDDFRTPVFLKLFEKIGRHKHRHVRGSGVHAGEIFVHLRIQRIKSFYVRLFERKKKFVEIFHHFYCRRGVFKSYLSKTWNAHFDASSKQLLLTTAAHTAGGV